MTKERQGTSIKLSLHHRLSRVGLRTREEALATQRAEPCFIISVEKESGNRAPKLPAGDELESPLGRTVERSQET